MTENNCEQGGDKRILNEQLNALNLLNKRTELYLQSLENLNRVVDGLENPFTRLDLRMGIAKCALRLMANFPRALDECLGGLEEKSDPK